MTLIIDGTDFSDFVADDGYHIGYETREGNSLITMDGTLHTNLQAIKTVISCEMNALTAEKLSELLQVALKQYVTATYFDTRFNDISTSIFIPTINEQNFAFNRHGVKFFRDGIKLSLRER